MAIPSPASDRMEMDCRMMASIWKFYLQDTNRSNNEAINQLPRRITRYSTPPTDACMPYRLVVASTDLKQMSDQMTPMRLE